MRAICEIKGCYREARFKAKGKYLCEDCYCELGLQND
jgi:hypothetical protein